MSKAIIFEKPNGHLLVPIDGSGITIFSGDSEVRFHAEINFFEKKYPKTCAAIKMLGEALLQEGGEEIEEIEIP